MDEMCALEPERWDELKEVNAEEFAYLCLVCMFVCVCVYSICVRSNRIFVCE